MTECVKILRVRRKVAANHRACQLTVPREFCVLIGLEPGDPVDVFLVDGCVIVRPVSAAVREVAQLVEAAAKTAGAP